MIEADLGGATFTLPTIVFVTFDDVSLGVPEPGAVALIGTGIAGLARLRRRAR